jgi:hypothetical protein
LSQRGHIRQRHALISQQKYAAGEKGRLMIASLLGQFEGTTRIEGPVQLSAKEVLRDDLCRMQSQAVPGE